MTTFTGRVFADRYEIGPHLEQVSRDSKLVTHRGRDRETGEDVVVVALRPDFASDAAIREEFRWGLERLTRLAHPGIMAVRHHEVDDAAGELLFVTNPLGPGSQTLSRLLKEGAVFTEAEAVHLARLTLQALQVAHGQGIYFGNVKPSNLIVAKDRARVVLNGIPKPPFEFSSIQQLGAYLGKPFACAPEHIATGHFDGRADVYGVGLVLYELTAGLLPFRRSDNLGVVFHAITNDALPAVTEHNPDVTPRLVEIIARAVAKDPGARYSSTADMEAALAKLQPRSTVLLTRSRLAEIVSQAMPFPIAQAHASIAHQPDEVAQLQRTVDTAHACITLVGAIVLASRARAKLPPIADDQARLAFARPSLGHWVAILREGTRELGSAMVPELATLLFDARGKVTGAAKAIDALVTVRNEVRHGATPTVGAARRLLAEHGSSLDRLLAALLFLRDYPLLVPRTLDFTDDEFVSDVSLLRGARAHERRIIRVRQPLSIGQVYVADAQLQRAISLSPLVVAAACPICEDEELFVYESASDERIHYLSAQKGHSIAREDLYPAFTKLGLL